MLLELCNLLQDKKKKREENSVETRVKEENTLMLVSILFSFSIKHQIRRQYQLIFFF